MVLHVVKHRRRFLHMQSDESWRLDSDLVITPDVGDVDWYAFGRGPALVQAGEAAAHAALPIIQEWLGRERAHDPDTVPATRVA
jgi:hypothetical protein